VGTEKKKKDLTEGQRELVTKKKPFPKVDVRTTDGYRIFLTLEWESPPAKKKRG